MDCTESAEYCKYIFLASLSMCFNLYTYVAVHLSYSFVSILSGTISSSVRLNLILSFAPFSFSLLDKAGPQLIKDGGFKLKMNYCCISVSGTITIHTTVTASLLYVSPHWGVLWHLLKLI